MHSTARRLTALAVGVAFATVLTAAAKADTPSYYTPPSFKVQVKPSYPESARAKHETGTVLVKVLVGTDGKPKSITIAKSSGHKDLDDVVLAAAKESTYSPAMRDGKPTIAYYDFTYKFTLSGLSENTAETGAVGKQLASNPHNVAARMTLIDSALIAGDYAKAESLADQGVQLMPSEARLWVTRGDAYYADGSKNSDVAKLKTSVDSYEQANKLKPGTVSNDALSGAYAEYAFNLMQKGQYAECMPYAQKALAAHTSMQNYMIRADCEAGLDPKSTAALADYQAAAKLDDHKNSAVSARLQASLGNVLLQQGNVAPGLQAINEAEKIDPQQPSAYMYLYSYWLGPGNNLNAALSPLLQLAQIQPKNADVQTRIGDIYVAQGNFPAAQAAFAKALGIDPNSGDATLGMAEIAAAQGNMNGIDGPLQKAISLSPGNAAVYNAQIAGVLLRQKSDYSAAAVRYAEAATKADPSYPLGWFYAGIAYADQNKKDQANSALRTAFNLYKAKGDVADMQQVDKQWQQLNGKSNSLMNGQGS